jgi:hypothetical protein
MIFNIYMSFVLRGFVWGLFEFVIFINSFLKGFVRGLIVFTFESLFWKIKMEHSLGHLN